MAQEVVLKFRGDNAQLLSSLNESTRAYTAAVAQITGQSRVESQAVIAVQRQLSSALIAEQRAQTRAREQEEKRSAAAILQEEKQLAAQMIRESKAAEAARAQAERQAAAAAISLQRQRSAALIAQWKQEEKATRDAAAGVVPLRQGLSGLTEVMRTLGASVGVLQGPLNGISGRLTSMGTLARLVAGDTEQVGAAAVQAGAGVATMTASAEGGTVAMGGLLASMGPVGIAAAGIAVEVVAAGVVIGLLAKGAISLAEEFFSLAKSAAGFRGELFDLSQQTGVSVETLNALAIVASKTGGSIESISQSLVIYQGHLDDAQDASSKTGRQFAELGITTNDTETSFRSALKALAAMPEGFRQTNTAAELFGKRGGKQVLAILKETNGDIDSAVSKLGNLARVSEEDARQADVFNDALRDLNIQIRGLVGKEAIPAATRALEELSRFLRENQGAVDALGAAIHLLGLAFEGWIQSLTTGASAINAIVQITARAVPGIIQLAEAYERAAKAAGLMAAIPGVTGGAQGIAEAQFRGAPASGGEAGLSATDEHQPARKTQTGGGRTARRRATSFDTDSRRALAEQQAQEDINNRLVDSYNKLQDELKGVVVSTHAYAIEQEILNGKLKDATPELQNEARETARLVDSSEKHLRLQKELKSFLEAQTEQVREATEGRKSELTIAMEFIAALEKEGAVLQESTKRYIENNAQLLRSIDIRNQLMEALDKQAGLEAVGIAQKGVDEDVISQAAGQAANAATIAEAQAADAAAEAMARQGEAMRILKEIGMDTFSSLAQGIGGLIQNWVLLGSAGPNATRKMVASILAAAAAQAAVEAIMELAYAAKEFAMASASAAVFDVAGAALHTAAAHGHLVAAAIFGTVGAAAAIGGRLIAGNAFQQTSSGGGGTSAGGSTSQAAEKPRSQDTNRRDYNTQPVEVRLTLAGGLHEVIEAHVVKNWNNNGRIRTTVQSDGQG